MKMTASQVVMECLLEQGVDTVFGYPGGTILNIYDEFELHGYSKKIHHILTAHEQGASHAADGYARSTGKVGVCFATSGPGATNLTTGIATAYMDSSPVVFITVNVGENLIGKDSFQEVDITGITMPITKCNYLVRDANELADIIREAFAIARSGRPGPVLIDILKNVTYDMVEYTPLPLSEHHRHGKLGRLMARESHDLTIAEPDHDDVNMLVELLKDCKRPLVLVGGGVIRSKGAVPEFRKFIEKLGAPVASTVMGGGACPGDHPLFTGMIGMHGNHASNIASHDCDMLIAIGCRFSDRVTCDVNTFAPNACVVQIDIDRAEIDKNVLTSHHIIGDARRVLELLNERIMLQEYDFSAWRKAILSLKEPPLEHSDDKLLPHEIAAFGAKLGNPDQVVVHCTGDGCFRMNCHEMATVQHYDIPVITIIFDNHTLGMVRQWQTLIYGQRYSQTTLDRGPDFVKLAEAYGIPGYRVTNVTEFEEAFQKALDSGHAAVIDAMLDIDEMVHPMVGGTSPVTNFLLD